MSLWAAPRCITGFLKRGGFLVSDARGEIGRALESRLSAEQVAFLLDAVLVLEKQGRGWCPGCKKQVWVSIPDAKAVTGALIDLANQAWGRPDVAAQADSERILFERVVYLYDAQQDPGELGGAA